MDENFSPRVKDVIGFSKEEALRLGHDAIGTEHLVLGLIRDGHGSAIDLIKSSGVDLGELRDHIEALIEIVDVHGSQRKNIPLTRMAEKALKTTFLEAKLYASSVIETAHMLLCILRNDNDPVAGVFKQLGVDYDIIKAAYSKDLPDTPLSGASMDTSSMANEGSHSSQSSSREKPEEQRKSKSTTPVLDNFGRDLTKLAEEDKLDPIVGREKEIERVSQILSRRKKNNPLLIGEPGVGKSAIAEGLALRIVKKQVSRVLFGKRVVTLDLASLIAGTKYRGQFEERMKAYFSLMNCTPSSVLADPQAHWTQATCSSRHWLMEKFSALALRPWMNTGNTLKKMAPWSAASKRSSWTQHLLLRHS
jgi:ATP-dependent Clp protease ATP-binding subunit ClpC